MLRPGQTVDFLYPSSNRYGSPRRLKPRRLLITAVIDTWAEPLCLTDILRDPLLRRSRWLIVGVDLDLGVQRSFYRESMSRMRVVERIAAA